jgi:hypothetical protein
MPAVRRPHVPAEILQATVHLAVAQQPVDGADELRFAPVVARQARTKPRVLDAAGIVQPVPNNRA